MSFTTVIEIEVVASDVDMKVEKGPETGASMSLQVGPVRVWFGPDAQAELVEQLTTAGIV